jgi:shikimate dehydrogenase
MHRAALSFFSINGSYELIDLAPEDLEEGICKIQSSGFSGFNVTIPHKEAVFRASKYKSLEAEIIGAANTVRIDSAGATLAHNTDLGGFVHALSLATKGESSLLSNPLLLGSGGAARACFAGLVLSGCARITLAARRVSEAEKICKHLLATLGSVSDVQANIVSMPFEDAASAGPFSLVVNCTSVGLDAVSASEQAEAFKPIFAAMQQQSLFFDTVYKRDRSSTILMAMARTYGVATVVDGLDMLVGQAALAFEYWTARRPDHELMKSALTF